jgi:DNA-binding response OmpR family regulator
MRLITKFRSIAARKMLGVELWSSKYHDCIANETRAERSIVRILLVERDRELAPYLASHLRRNGYEVEHTSEGSSAIREAHRADLVLLNLDTTDVCGMDACRLIRQNDDVAIIVTLQDGVCRQKITALQAGADDCLVKPFGLRELSARIDAVLRRSQVGAGTQQLSYPPLHIDGQLRVASMAGLRLELTEKEFDLLWYLAAKPDAVRSRSEIMSRVWRDTGNSRSRTIDTHVSSLRGKLGQLCWIDTVHGVGFRFRCQLVTARSPLCAS